MGTFRKAFQGHMFDKLVPKARTQNDTSPVELVNQMGLI